MEDLDLSIPDFLVRRRDPDAPVRHCGLCRSTAHTATSCPTKPRKIKLPKSAIRRPPKCERELRRAVKAKQAQAGRRARPAGAPA